jgi:hypothetical protein
LRFCTPKVNSRTPTAPTATQSESTQSASLHATFERSVLRAGASALRQERNSVMHCHAVSRMSKMKAAVPVAAFQRCKFISSPPEITHLPSPTTALPLNEVRHTLCANRFVSCGKQAHQTCRSTRCWSSHWESQTSPARGMSACMRPAEEIWGADTLDSE